MKSIIYKNPVISAVVLNIITLIVFIYAINEKGYAFTMIIIAIAIVNTRIVDNGKNINKMRKAIIYMSFILMSIIYISYAMHKIYGNH